MCETKKLFDFPEFEKRFHSQLPPGAFPAPNGALFRLWAPTAEKIVLRLCPAGDGGEAEEVHPLLPEGSGTWAWGTSRDLDGTASERSMCARYILDSVLFWTEEYHMDGFRFDLMGLLDVELMENIRTALDERFGQGEKLLYGEPWTGGETHPHPGTKNRGLVDYYRGLIALRKRLPGLCDKSPFAPERVSKVQEPAPDCVTPAVDNSGGDSPWERLFLVYSARSAEVEITLPNGGWELPADGESSFLWNIPEIWTGHYLPAPVSAAIFGHRKR